MYLIFDLDQTLVDTQALEVYRNSKDWKKVYSLIPTVKLFEGFEDVLNILRQQGHKVAIVTSSPSVYCSKVLSHCKITCETLVCYHDTSRKKPNPDPILLAIEKLGISSENLKNTFSFGDKAIDIIASKRANVKSVACTWGALNSHELIAAEPDYIINQVDEIFNFIEP